MGLLWRTMKIHKWLSDSMSAVIGLAVVEVEPGEVADYDKMVSLVDTGLNFGTSVDLMTLDEPPKYEWSRQRGTYPKYNMLAINASPDKMQDRRRFYRVHVSRD